MNQEATIFLERQAKAMGFTLDNLLDSKYKFFRVMPFEGPDIYSESMWFTCLWTDRIETVGVQPIICFFILERQLAWVKVRKLELDIRSL